jgi:hypothetical protein
MTERRKTRRAKYLLPFMGKRKVDRIKTVVEMAALVLIILMIASCEEQFFSTGYIQLSGGQPPGSASVDNPPLGGLRFLNASGAGVSEIELAGEAGSESLSEPEIADGKSKVFSHATGTYTATVHKTAGDPFVRSGIAITEARETLVLVKSDGMEVIEIEVPQPANPGDTTPPGKIRNFTATAGDSHVILNWELPADADFYETWLYYSPNNSSGWIPVAKPTNTATIGGLDNGTFYTFIAIAVDTSSNVSEPVYARATPINGLGTTPMIDGVEVSPPTPTVPQGGNQPFSATVFGTPNPPPQTVTWSIESPHHAGTKFYSTFLVVAAGETAQSLTVRATSTVDDSKYGEMAVTVTLTGAAATVTSVTVTPPNPATVQKGGAGQFAATVTGTNNPAQTVSWSVDTPHHASTTITTGGLLTVAEGETAATLTVRATSAADTGKSGTAVVTVRPPAASVTLNTHQYLRLNTIDGDDRNTITLTAAVEPAGALQEVVWTMVETGGGDSPRVQIIGTGLTVTVKGINGGEVSVYATAADGSGKTDICELWVAR